METVTFRKACKTIANELVKEYNAIAQRIREEATKRYGNRRYVWICEDRIYLGRPRNRDCTRVSVSECLNELISREIDAVAGHLRAKAEIAKWLAENAPDFEIEAFYVATQTIYFGSNRGYMYIHRTGIYVFSADPYIRAVFDEIRRKAPFTVVIEHPAVLHVSNARIA